MKVYQVIFEVTDGEKITNEECYWTAPSLFAAAAAASSHAYEYEKSVTTVRYILTVTRDVDFKDGQKMVEAGIDYGLLEGEGKEPEDE